MKTAIISGASQGIGAKIAQTLSTIGYYVVINYNKNEEMAKKSLQNAGGNGCIFQADVSKYIEVKNMVNYAIKLRGKIDLLVCNAGISKSGLLIDMQENDIQEMLNVNLLGTINCCKAVSEHMLREQSGNIINISSMWGEVGASCESVYSASKGGVIAFTKSLAKELGYNNIKVNAITPGLIDTNMNKDIVESDLHEIIRETPCGRIGTPQDIANAVVWLASENSSFVNGQIIGVNGGLVI